MPLVLDTDHLSVLQWQVRPACDRLLDRLDRLPPVVRRGNWAIWEADDESKPA